MRRLLVLVCGALLLATRPARAQVITVSADKFELTTGPCVILSGSGFPEGSVTGSVCSVYIETNTGNTYIKTSGSGNTGWSLLPRIDAANAFTVAQEITNAAPALTLTESDQGTDLKKWRVAAEGQTLLLQAVNDAISSGVNVLTSSRAGDITIARGLTASQAVTINANAAALPAPIAGTLLQIGQADGTVPRITMDSFAQASFLAFRRANNTNASKTALAANDVIVRIGANGYGATAYPTGLRVGIDLVAAEAWTDTVQGTHIAFLTSALGTATLSEKLRIQASGGMSLGAGNTLDPGAGSFSWTANLLPASNYASNVGSLTKRLLQVHAAELMVETLVAQNTAATIGGRILVAPTNTLTADLSAGGTTITVKYNNFTNGDRIYLEEDGALEWMAVTSSAGGSAGAYTYTVTRNLDGSGANAWTAGAAAVDTGTTGNGVIDIYSVAGILGTGSGPSIVGNVRTGTTYSNMAARWAIGNLNGLYGYVATTYGAAFGDASATNVTVDATNGFRIRSSTTNKFAADTSGNLSLTGDLAMSTSGVFRAGATAFATGTGWWLDYNAGTPRFRIGNPAGANASWNGTTFAITDGSLSFNSGAVTLDTSGLFISPVSGSGGGTYANANAVRWTTDTTYRTAIWRSDDTGGTAQKYWNFDHVENGGSVVNSYTDFTSKIDNGAGPAHGIGKLRLRGHSSNGGETQLIAEGSTATARDAFLYLGTLSTSNTQTMAWGWGTPAPMTSTSNGGYTLTGGIEMIAGSGMNIKGAGGMTTITITGMTNLYFTGSTAITGISEQSIGTTSAHDFFLASSGSNRATVCSGGGMTVGSPTGGCKGVGTLNATAVYDDNVLLTDWVFEAYYSGQRPPHGDGPARDWPPSSRRLYTLDEVRDVTSVQHRLPWMPRASEFETERHTGGMITRLYQGQEQQQLYIQELEARIRVLEQGAAARPR